MRTSILFRRRYDEHVFLIIAQEKIAILNKIFLRVESFFIYFTILCSKELSLGDYFKGNKRSFYFLIFIARRYILSFTNLASFMPHRPCNGKFLMQILKLILGLIFI